MSKAGLSKAEKQAVAERARELKAEAKAGKAREAGLAALLAAIEKLPEDDAAIARELHAIVERVAPHLAPKTFYGFPAWANADGKIVCFFQPKSKFDTRHGTFAFEDAARLDDGDFWPTSFAVRAMTPSVAKRVAELVERAAPAA
jgi:uncharacterized protein YdhG (YjbR/CyaY superfamily)